jgi:hypothetical protein
MKLLIALVFIFTFSTQQANAACGANTRKWQADAGTTAWNTNNNWTPRNRPNASTENALIVSDWRVPAYPNSNYTLGCFEIQSGSLDVAVSRRLTIVGDYFRNIHAGSLNVAGGNTWEVRMEGTGPQEFTNLDSIPRLRINNADTVNITESFIITNRFQIIDGSGLINIEKGMTVSSTAGNVTIPATASVYVKSGATLIIDRNLTIDGVLRIEAGGKLEMGNGRTLSVSAGGLLQLDGASGNIATISSISGSFNFNVLGDINLNYFTVSNTTANGMNVTGSIQALANGTFQNIANNGSGITLGAASSIPLSIDEIGFFDAGAVGTQYNINATAYTGAVATITNFSGIGGEDDDNDPGNKIDWGTAAAAALQITDESSAGVPAASISAGTTDSHVATYAFSMTATAATATDITSIKVTLGGSNLASDISDMKIMKDMNGNCTYEPGTDTQIGSDLHPSGSPASDTLTLVGSEISVIDTTQACIHILASVNATGQSGNTVSMFIAATDDVLNSEGYDWSVSGSPPLNTDSFTISGAETKIWNGGNSGSWTTAADWTTNGVPNSALNCQIGSGFTVADFPNTTERACQNAILQTGGALDWVNRTTVFAVHGSLTIGSSYSFNNAVNGSISMKGPNDQSIVADTTYPGDFDISSTGGNVSLDSNFRVSGDFTLTSGNFEISSGYTLTIDGDVTVNGGTFTMNPGSTLVLGNGSTVAVAAAGELIIVGNSSQSASMEAINNASSYVVNISGTVAARYYSFSNLGTTGVTVNSGASINATNHFQNGSFTYPGANSATLLRLNRKIPTDTLDQMVFDSNGSGATGTQAISTNTTAGTLTISNFSGDRTDDPFSTSDPSYIVDWGTATNTLKLTQDATGPASVNQGQTYNMGRFAFTQTQAGSFNNTDITSITITMNGSGNSSDVAGARLYYDASCTGSGGTLLGTASFSGSPAKATFSSLTGFTVESDVTTPPKRCTYLEIDVDSLATSAQTIGFEITSNSDVTNSEAYAFNGSASPTVNLGSAATIIGSTTVWTGNTSTAWNNAGNWSSGVPTASINCIINNAANNPTVTGTQVCKSLTNGNGTITMSGGSTLELYGSFENTGTFTQSGNALVFKDNGATPSTQTITSSSVLESITFDKTAGGSIITGGNLTVTNQVLTGSGNSYEFIISGGTTSTFQGGLQCNGATFNVKQTATLKIGSGQDILVNGCTFQTTGTNDAYPQSLSNKSKIEAVSGTFGFTTTSGNVFLRGFLIDGLDNDGLNFGGTTNITGINGGQLTSLSTSYAAMKAIQFNNSGTKPSLVTNFGWQWDSTPANTEPYTVASSTGCGGASISFDGWFGNWYENTPTFDTSTKVSNSSCNITLDGSASPVSLTSFDARGFNNAIELKWTTGLEFEHAGFNVYKSNSPDLGFVQINDKLIRNNLYSGSIHGSYVFHDLKAINNETYYYMLEDISVTGARKWHGPISAQALAVNGAIPTPTIGDIFEDTNNGGATSGDDSTINNPTPDQREIATGVQIISETNNALRLKITIPNFTTSDVSGTSYKNVLIDGYSLTQVPGQARLPYRTILVNVPDSSSATFEIVSSSNTETPAINVVPADEYVVSGNTVIPQNVIDTDYYNLNAYTPASTISLGTIAQSSGRNILPLTIHPLQFNPNQEKVKHFSEIVVDIFLDGRTDWSQTIPTSTVWATEAGLKIGIEKKGLYSLTYDELSSAGVDLPFSGTNINDLKLYIKEFELPIIIDSADSFFNSGDKITFYSPYFKNIYSKYTHLLLINDSGSGDGVRVSDVSGAPIPGENSLESGYYTKLHFEENTKAYFKEPYSSDEDHILWATFYSPPTNAGDDFFTQEVELGDLDQTGEVEIHALLKGSRIGNYNDLTHHVSVWVNNNETSASVTFSTADPYYAVFKIPGTSFSPGKNKIQFQAKGTFVSTTDLVDIDYFDIYYKKNWVISDNYTQIESYEYNKNLYFENFASSSIRILDISDISNIKNLTSGSTVLGSGKYSLEFNQGTGRKFIIAEESSELQVTTLSLIDGSNLRDVANEAQILYIGPADLINAISPLADFRKSQGFSYRSIDIAEIYNEFGKGEHSADSLKSFIQYAYENWNEKPQYIVLLGDSTYDPKGQLGSVPRNSIPLKLIKGQFYDYGSDNWYVSFTEGSSSPAINIGRIPGNEAHQVESYAQKVIDYEEGRNSTSVNFDKQIQLIIDKDQADDTFENFDAKADALKKKILSLTPSAYVTDTRRSTLTDAETQNKIQDAFDDGRSIIHYLGHGAEDMWSDYSIFTNTEAKALTNTNYPLVVAMNCLNSYFYYSDEEDKGLAEELVLNSNGGAIAFWGSTSFTTPGQQNPFQDAFYSQILTSEARLGEAIRLAKVNGGAFGGEEVVNSWTLIGDPLLKIKILKKQTQASTAIKKESSGGGGCSISDRNTPWYFGLLELLFALTGLILVRKWTIRQQ